VVALAMEQNDGTGRHGRRHPCDSAAIASGSSSDSDESLPEIEQVDDGDVDKRRAHVPSSSRAPGARAHFRRLPGSLTELARHPKFRRSQWSRRRQYYQFE